ncbi:MAG: selenide, water dikinase SelD [Oceanococcaceae bacterium]
MTQFSRLPQDRAAMKTMPAARDDTLALNELLPCGGCGAKVGSQPLHAALRDLRARFPQHALPEGAQGEDVAILPPLSRPVQSIDTLRTMIDDPFLMGAIAAQHALSDIYAAGATPRAALASVTLPFARDALLRSDLEQVLAGALSVLADADCPLLGGHSMQAAEGQVGFVITAEAPLAGALRCKRSGQAGDHLLLTKPLGSGVIFAAAMQHQADGRVVGQAVRQMRESNAVASRVATQWALTAVTDVTGFGLLGHLVEMLPDGVGAVIDPAAVPLVPGALELAVQGVRSSLWPANFAAVAPFLDADALPPLSAHPAITADVVNGRDHGDAERHGTADSLARRALLLDPQTSGGLLMAVPADHAHACLKALQAAGLVAADIGRLRADPQQRVQFAPAA